jgi:hypothetical protein
MGSRAAAAAGHARLGWGRVLEVFPGPRAPAAPAASLGTALVLAWVVAQAASGTACLARARPTWKASGRSALPSAANAQGSELSACGPVLAIPVEEGGCTARLLSTKGCASVAGQLWADGGVAPLARPMPSLPPAQTQTHAQSS